MNIEKLYQDYSIDYPTEGKNYTEGWINTRCPFCDDSSQHLGFNIDEQYYNCWRCGHHYIDETIAKLLGVKLAEARKIMKVYSDTPVFFKKEPEVKIRASAFKFPSGTGRLEKPHIQYLEKRNFDPYRLEKTWGLLATGPVAMLDGLNYRHRIIVPFVWDDINVSFDSRDITGKHSSRYMACPKKRELIPHKEILYGRQDLWTSTGICVEGPTDVWRLGVNAFAVSGIKYTEQQVRIIAKFFKRVFVLFDQEEQAQLQAAKLCSELQFRNVEAVHLENIIESDPGSLTQKEADYLIKNLLK